MSNLKFHKTTIANWWCVAHRCAQGVLRAKWDMLKGSILTYLGDDMFYYSDVNIL